MTLVIFVRILFFSPWLCHEQGGIQKYHTLLNDRVISRCENCFGFISYIITCITYSITYRDFLHAPQTLYPNYQCAPYSVSIIFWLRYSVTWEEKMCYAHKKNTKTILYSSSSFEKLSRSKIALNAEWERSVAETKTTVLLYYSYHYYIECFCVKVTTEIVNK